MITDFEHISELGAETCKGKLQDFSTDILVRAYKGTSPENALFLESTFTNIDFKKESELMGRVRIEEVDEAQAAVLAVINR